MEPTQNKSSKLKKIGIGLIVLLIVGLAGTSFYFYKKAMANTQKAQEAEVKALVAKVSKLVVLPTDETPTVATVSDPKALADQAFFAGAVEGDKVLIYTNAKKAVLYSPTMNKIINVAPLNIGQNSKSTLEQPAAQTAPKTEDKPKN